MTTKVGNVVVIAPERARTCELCGKNEECRPAGPNGEQVCFECAQKDKTALERYATRLFGPKPVMKSKCSRRKN